MYAAARCITPDKQFIHIETWRKLTCLGLFTCNIKVFLNLAKTHMIELLKKFENKRPEIVFEWKDAETEA